MNGPACPSGPAFWSEFASGPLAFSSWLWEPCAAASRASSPASLDFGVRVDGLTARFGLQ